MPPEPTVISLQNVSETLALGEQLGKIVPTGTVLLLTGDIGSGKTTLIKGLGLGLGIAETIDSPTFTLISEYIDGRIPLYHIDLYRIEKSEVGGLFLDTYWEGQEVEPGITAIEWAERLSWSPPDSLHIDITHQEKGRQVTLIPANESHVQLLKTLHWSR